MWRRDLFPTSRPACRARTGKIRLPLRRLLSLKKIHPQKIDHRTKSQDKKCAVIYRALCETRLPWRMYADHAWRLLVVCGTYMVGSGQGRTGRSLLRVTECTCIYDNSFKIPAIFSNRNFVCVSLHAHGPGVPVSRKMVGSHPYLESLGRKYI